MRVKGLNAIGWGAVWGLSEALLGYALHVLSVALPGIPGFVMFPVAFAFMIRAYGEERSVKMVTLCTVTAASIKALDFLIPGHDPIRIINPILSILLEGGAVAWVLTWNNRFLEAVPPMRWLTMGILWRGIFLMYMAILAVYGLPAGLVTNGIALTLRFLILESLINAGLMEGLRRVPLAKTLSFKPIQIAFVLSLALLIEGVL